MKKKDESQPTGAPPTGRGGERGRFNSQRKTESVLRLLKGEDLDVLSRELCVSAATLAGWKEVFFAAGQAGLKSRQADIRDKGNAQLRALVAERSGQQLVLPTSRQNSGYPWTPSGGGWTCWGGCTTASWCAPGSPMWPIGRS